MDLVRKIVFVTGAARGLGKAYSRGLLQNGAKVCLADVNKEVGQATVTELHTDFGKDNSMFVHCDVSNGDQFSSAFAQAISQFGKVDVLINNAGIMQEKVWEQMVDINVKGLIRGNFLALEHMRKDKGGAGGVVVNVSSFAGLKVVPGGLIPAYSATKFAVQGLTRNLAEYCKEAKLGIRVVCLCPTAVDTDLVWPSKQPYGISLDDEKWTNFIDISKSSLLTSEFMTEALLRLLREEDNNGKIMLAKTKGAVYFNF